MAKRQRLRRARKAPANPLVGGGTYAAPVTHLSMKHILSETKRETLMKPIITHEDVAAPDGTLVKMRIVVYDRYSTPINGVHSLMINANKPIQDDATWYAVGETNAALPDSPFPLGGSMQVFGGTAIVRYTHEADYALMVAVLRMEMLEHIEVEYPAELGAFGQPGDSALLGPISVPGQNVDAFFAKAAASLADTPLDDDTVGLVELAEHIADGLESGDIVLIDNTGKSVFFVDEGLPGDGDVGAVMFLTFEQSEFMTQVCRFEALLVYLHQTDAIRMAGELEAGGLVTVDRVGPFWVVSAVRGESDDDNHQNHDAAPMGKI